MEPSSLSFLTLITKLRVIPCSAFGVLQNTPSFNWFSRKTHLVSVHNYSLTSVFGFRYLQKFHVKKEEEKTNSSVIKQLTSRMRGKLCNTEVVYVHVTRMYWSQSLHQVVTILARSQCFSLSLRRRRVNPGTRMHHKNEKVAYTSCENAIYASTI